MQPRPYPLYAYLVIILTACFSLIYNASLPLYLDEAYYWLWSKNLDFGYLDHPYMIALFIKAATFFGDTQSAIRLVSVVCSLGSAVFVYALARRAFDDKTAFVSLIIYLLSPALTMGLSITTPDAPLILFWSAGLYFAYIAIFESKPAHYLSAGVAFGLAMSSKYTAILAPAALFLFLLLRRRGEFAKTYLWLGVGACALAFSPVVYWNYLHEWVSFAFQFKHGTSEVYTLNLPRFFEFFGGLFVIFSPLFFGYALYYLAKLGEYKDSDKLLFLAVNSLFVICFFLYKGLFKKMELNWVAPAFLPLAIFVAYFLVQKNHRKLLLAGLTISLLLGFVLRFPSEVGLKKEKNFHSRIYGYKEMADEVARIATPKEQIFADHLTLASILSYHLQDRARAMIPTDTRVSMFSYWDKDANFAKMDGIYVSKDDRSGELAKIWQNVALLEIFQTSSSEFSSKKFYIYRVAN